MVDAMTIIGTPHECANQMDNFFKAGVDEIRLVFNEPDVDGYREGIQSLAPYLRSD